MNIAFRFFRGMGICIEFPGDGVNMVLDLLIIRILFISDDYIDEFLAENGFEQ